MSNFLLTNIAMCEFKTGIQFMSKREMCTRMKKHCAGVKANLLTVRHCTWSEAQKSPLQSEVGDANNQSRN